MRKPAVAEFEKYLNVIRGWDSSPRDVEIGETLADLLAPMARYRRLREDGEWELVPYERAKELGLRNKRGVLETYASTATIMWTEKKHASAASCDLAASDWDKLVQRKEELPSGCSFIQDTSAGTYLEAWDGSYEKLSMEDIFQIAESSGRSVSVSISADMAASNVRMVLDLIEQIVAFNERMRAAAKLGRVLALLSWCRGHIIMNAITGIVMFKRVVPKVYATSFALRFPPRYRRFAKLLFHILEKDLTEGGLVAAEPQPAWADHFKQMLKLTLLRHERTRGRARHDESKPNDDLRLRYLEDKLVDSYRCDTRLDRFQYYSPNTELSIRQIATNASLAMTEGFLEGMEVRPSTSKWWTLEPSLTRACGMSTTCNIFRRVGSISFDEADPTAGPNEHSDSEEENFQAYCRKQVVKAQEHASDPNAGCELAQVLWTAEPADGLSKACQHDDLEQDRQPLFELLKEEGPHQTAQRQYFAMITGSGEEELNTIPRSTVVHQFDVPDPSKDATEHAAEMDELAEQYRVKALAISARLWAAVGVPLENSPLEHIGMGDRNIMPGEQLGKVAALRAKAPCCLDPACGVPLQDVVHRYDDLSFTEGGGCTMVHNMGASSFSTNMHLEHKLKQVISAVVETKGGQRHPTAEKVAAVSTLATVLQTHIDAGGVDGRKRSRAEMVEAGVPLAVTRSKRKTDRRGSTRWSTVYGNVKMQDFDDQWPDATHADRKRQRADYCKRWPTLWEAEQNEFIAANTRNPRNPAIRNPRKRKHKVKLRNGGLTLWQRIRMGAQTTWPIEPKQVRDYLQEAVTNQQQWSDRAPPVRQVGGIVRRGYSARKKTKQRLTFTNQGRLPANKRLNVRLACWQAHLGLCIERDKAIFSRANAIAAGMNKFFKARELYNHFRLRNASPGVVRGSLGSEVYYWFAFVRPKRPEVYTTVAFARETLREGSLYLDCSPKGGPDYVSTHGIGRLLALKAWDIVAVERVEVDVGKHPAPIFWLGGSPSPIILWPPDKSTIPVSEKKKAAPDAALDDLPSCDVAAPKAKSKRRSGGVKYITPLKALELKDKVDKGLPNRSSSESECESDSNSWCSAPDLKEKNKKPKAKAPKGPKKPKAPSN